jgi:NADP-dependent 3-hydroxy acid dehydrogenase YdfG
MSKVYFITGTSSGFGRALAEAALERGERVVLAARKLSDVEELARNTQTMRLPLNLMSPMPMSGKPPFKPHLRDLGALMF